MKPRYRIFLKSALPALIVLPMFSLSVEAGSSHIISPDAAGDVNVAGDYDELNGADWTVAATGGNASPFMVTIGQGASLTGDTSRNGVVEVSSGYYTIENSGSLNGTYHGILSMAGDTAIINHEGALIQGAWNGISFENRETITVLDTVDTVSGNASVTNHGEIIGMGNGIFGGSGLTVVNGESGEITGHRGSGIFAGGNLTLTNDGSIIGASDSIFSSARNVGPFFPKGGGSGVFSRGDAEITNNGSITGENGHGVYAAGKLTLTNNGTIQGNGVSSFDVKFISPEEPPAVAIGTGVLAGNQTTITNNPGGVISGSLNGIWIFNNELEIGRTLAPTPAIDLSSTIINHGLISGTDGTGILGSDEQETVNNDNGRITGSVAAIDLAGGNDIINLGFGSVVQGDIAGGDGTDVIHFTSGSQSSSDESNIVHGNVGGIETINKTGEGFAFIGGAGESFNVFTDTINVSSGGLIINGNLASLSEGKTVVNLSGGGRLDGTGTWNADLTVTDGGFSAGGTNSLLDGEGGPVIVSALKSASSSGSFDSVGTLTINGNFNVETDILTPPVPQAQPVSSPIYIREDILPGKPIVDGVNSDLIVQNGVGNTFNVAGMDIRLAPTDINLTLTDGTYTIVDSDSPLAGVAKIGEIGVQFSANAPDTGEFIASESGENNRNTVLGKYFSTIATGDPVEPVLEKASGNPLNSNLLVKIKHDYQGLPGLTDNQSGFAAAIDASVNSPNAQIQDFISAMDYSDLSTVLATLATLDPGKTMGLADVVVNSNYRLHRLTQDHLAAVRGTSREIAEAAAPVKDAKGAIVESAPAVRTAGRGNAWGSVSYDGQDYDAPGNPADFDGDSGSFTAGVDWLVAPQLVLGVVFDGTKGNFDGQGSDSDVDSLRGAVYGTWGGGLGFYSDFLAGYGSHDLDSDVDAAGVLTRKLSSSTDADSLQALWTAGYTMGDSRLKHGPFGGFEYQSVDVDGYTQGGNLPVQVKGFDVDSLRALIGYRVNANLGTFRPYASAVYAHEFEDGNNTTTATFLGNSFKVSGAEQGSAILIGIGTGIAINESLTLDVGYRGDIAVDDGLTSHGASLGVNYSF